MNPTHVKKKWQNLISGKCVKCDGVLHELEGRKGIMQCENTVTNDCDFFISRRKIFDILSDENHIMRIFLSFGEREKLEKAMEQAYDAMYI